MLVPVSKERRTRIWASRGSAIALATGIACAAAACGGRVESSSSSTSNASMSGTAHGADPAGQRQGEIPGDQGPGAGGLANGANSNARPTDSGVYAAQDGGSAFLEGLGRVAISLG